MKLWNYRFCNVINAFFCRTVLSLLHCCNTSLSSDTSATSAAWKNFLYLIFLFKWSLPGFSCSSITPPSSSQNHLFAAAQFHSQNQSSVKASSNVFCIPSNTHKWLICRDGRMNTASFSTQSVPSIIHLKWLHLYLIVLQGLFSLKMYFSVLWHLL